MKNRIKNALIGWSVAGAFVAFVGAASTIGSPDVALDELPVLIGIMAVSGAWLSLAGYANRKRKRHPPSAHGRVSGHIKHLQAHHSTFCAGKEGENENGKSING